MKPLNKIIRVFFSIVLFCLISCSGEKVKKELNTAKHIRVESFNNFRIEFFVNSFQVKINNKLNCVGYYDNHNIYSISPTIAKVASDIGFSSYPESVDVVTIANFGVPGWEPYFCLEVHSTSVYKYEESKFVLKAFTERGEQPKVFNSDSYAEIMKNIKMEDFKNNYYCIYFMALPFDLEKFKKEMDMISHDFSSLVISPSSIDYLTKYYFEY